MDVQFITKKSAIALSPPNEQGRENLLVLETGLGFAEKIESGKILENVTNAVTHISHWHEDHYYDAAEFARLCERNKTAAFFLAPPNEYDADVLFRNLKDLGVRSPEFIKRQEAERFLDLRSINFEKLRHGIDMYSWALTLEDNVNAKRNLVKHIPDNNDVKKARGLFENDQKRLKLCLFDATDRPQHDTNHLSLDSVLSFNIPNKIRPRHVVWHYPLKGKKKFEATVKKHGFDIYKNYLHESVVHEAHWKHAMKEIENYEQEALAYA